MAKKITDLTSVLTDKKRADRRRLVRSVAVEVKQSFPDMPNVEVMRAIFRASNEGHNRERLTKDEVWSAVADAAVAVAVNSEVVQ
ncbi:hypothetical protein ACOJCT_004402 [Cronobacter dublinensis]